MRYWILVLNIVAALALNVGCKSPYAPIKTLAEVGLEIRTAYADAYVSGIVPSNVHERAMRADAEYLRAQRALRVALQEAKAIGAEPDTVSALLRAKESLVPIIEIVGEYVSAHRAKQLQADLNNAKP